MNTDDDSILANFLGGCFHQDWPYEAETAEQIVEIFLREASPKDTAQISAAISVYVKSEPNDEVLEEKLYSEFDCYYLPSADGLTARAWLLSVADLLAKHSLEKKTD